MVLITDRGHTEGFLQLHATVCNEACPVLGGRDLVPRGDLFYVVLGCSMESPEEKEYLTLWLKSPVTQNGFTLSEAVALPSHSI